MNHRDQPGFPADPNLMVILGPTASGKTRLAVAAAEVLGGEIISADSRQVFRRMDIGTGKDLADYGNIPYHLIDLLEPGDEFSVFAFQQHFIAAFSQITSRGRLPILAGGTGLYLDAVLRGYEFSEVPENQTLRSELALLSMDELKARLVELNPQLHNSTDLLERERLLRAIEIASADSFSRVSLPDLHSVIFGIRMARDVVRQRITARLRERLQNGMIEEVGALLAEGVPPERLDAYGLEYRYINLHLSGRLNRNDMYQKLNSAIHDFAKRQENWFRKMEKHGLEIIWLDGSKEMLPQLLNEWRLRAA